jgi:uncharacterized coiled-coil DUF342 family protein
MPFDHGCSQYQPREERPCDTPRPALAITNPDGTPVKFPPSWNQINGVDFTTGKAPAAPVEPVDERVERAEKYIHGFGPMHSVQNSHATIRGLLDVVDEVTAKRDKYKSQRDKLSEKVERQRKELSKLNSERPWIEARERVAIHERDAAVVGLKEFAERSGDDLNHVKQERDAALLRVKELEAELKKSNEMICRLIREGDEERGYSNTCKSEINHLKAYLENLKKARDEASAQIESIRQVLEGKGEK